MSDSIPPSTGKTRAEARLKAKLAAHAGTYLADVLSRQRKRALARASFKPYWTHWRNQRGMA